MRKIINLTLLAALTTGLASCAMPESGSARVADTPAAASQEIPELHIVQPGDTLSQIAEQYGITLGELRAANPGISDLIFPHQEIRLPQPGHRGVMQAPPSDPSLPEIYDRAEGASREVVTETVRETEVRVTETPAEVKEEVRETVRTATETIETVQEEAVIVGTKVKEYPPLPPGTRAHIVQKGDTLYSIARRYGVSVSSIKVRNELDSSTIQPDQRLIIPSL